MTITAFVPDWNTNDEMREFAEGRKGFTAYVGAAQTFVSPAATNIN